MRLSKIIKCLWGIVIITMFFIVGGITGMCIKDHKKLEIMQENEIPVIYIVSDNLFTDISETDIKCSIYKALNLYKKRKLNNNQIEVLTEVLYIGHTDYNVNYIDMLSTILTESDFKIRAYSKNNKYNKFKKVRYTDSIDYGLCQINSKNLKKLYKASKKVLDKYSIKYTMSKYDIAVNVMSSILHKSSIQKQIVTRKSKYHNEDMQKVVAYNVGVRGSTLKSRVKLAKRYYTRYSKFKEKIKI